MTKNPVNQEQKILKSFFHPLARNKEALELKNDAAYLFKKKKNGCIFGYDDRRKAF